LAGVSRPWHIHRCADFRRTGGNHAKICINSSTAAKSGESGRADDDTDPRSSAAAIEEVTGLGCENPISKNSLPRRQRVDFVMLPQLGFSQARITTPLEPTDHCRRDAEMLHVMAIA
jgi:hypothetical protein